jgi:hypothetical protein
MLSAKEIILSGKEIKQLIKDIKELAYFDAKAPAPAFAKTTIDQVSKQIFNKIKQLFTGAAHTSFSPEAWSSFRPAESSFTPEESKDLSDYLQKYYLQQRNRDYGFECCIELLKKYEQTKKNYNFMSHNGYKSFYVYRFFIYQASDALEASQRMRFIEKEKLKFVKCHDSEQGDDCNCCERFKQICELRSNTSYHFDDYIVSVCHKPYPEWLWIKQFLTSSYKAGYNKMITVVKPDEISAIMELKSHEAQEMVINGFEQLQKIQDKESKPADFNRPPMRNKCYVLINLFSQLTRHDIPLSVTLIEILFKDIANNEMMIKADEIFYPLQHVHRQYLDLNLSDLNKWLREVFTKSEFISNLYDILNFRNEIYLTDNIKALPLISASQLITLNLALKELKEFRDKNAGWWINSELINILFAAPQHAKSLFGLIKYVREGLIIFKKMNYSYSMREICEILWKYRTNLDEILTVATHCLSKSPTGKIELDYLEEALVVKRFAAVAPGIHSVFFRDISRIVQGYLSDENVISCVQSLKP